MIATETPDLARRTCHGRYSREEQEHEKNGAQHVGRREGARSIVDHHNDRVVGGLRCCQHFSSFGYSDVIETNHIDELLDVMDAEAERDEHRNAHNAVQNNTPHHSFW